MTLTALPLALLLLAPAAAKPNITDLQVALDGRRIDVSFRYSGGLDPDTRARIDSGLPAGLIYDFRLYRDFQRWLDDEIGAAEVAVTAMYNAVTQEYLVNTKVDGELVDSRLVRGEVELERAMTRFDSMPLFELAPDLDTDRRLLLRGRVEYGSGRALGFIPTLRHTEWVRSRKFHVPPPPG